MTGIAGPQSMPVAGRRSLVLRLRLLAFGALACRNDAGRGSTSSGRAFVFR